MTDQAHSEPATIEQGIQLALSSDQEAARLGFRRFVDEHIVPHAGDWDREECVPRRLIDALIEQGYLAAIVPRSVGGGGIDAVTYGLLTEELGRGCSSVRSLLTVHDMVTLAVLRWGNTHLRETWVPRMAKAELLAALALSEPGVGSDAASVETEARRDGDDFVLSGRKKWITYGQIADLFLVLARCEGKVTAFLVPADTPGLVRHPLRGMAGTRASLLAELELTDCRLPSVHLVGRVGFGFSHVAASALDHGRYSVAWGAVGIAQACLDACAGYTAERRQFGARLNEHALVQRLLTEMIANTRAARLLCYRAGYLRVTDDPGATAETMIAKYFASRTAVRAANDAVQLHGANGLSDAFPVARFLRDAKVTEIIEGSTQIQQLSIPRLPLQEL